MACRPVMLAGAFVLGTAGCAVTVTPYGEEASPKKTKPAPAETTALETGASEAARQRPRAEQTTSSPLETTPSPCQAQDVTWAGAGTSCTAHLEAALEAGASAALVDPTGAATGKVTVTCENGQLTKSNATCELPQVFDVGSSTGCIDGYCSAATSGQCGVPDEAKAKALCVFKGFAKHVAFQTMPGPNDMKQCKPDGQGCFVNANPSCNIVFKSVTCVAVQP